MRTLLVLGLFCFSQITAMAASAALVIRDDGYYLLSSDSTELVKVSAVVDQRTSTDNPIPNDPVVPPSSRATKISELTKGVGTHEEAVTLAAVARSLADTEVSGSVAWDTAFRLTLNRVSGSISDPWEEWKGKVDAIAGDYSPQFFADVSSGISTAHGLNAVALKAVADGDTAVDQSADLGLEREEIKMTEIIELIRMILQLLKDLGVFDNNQGAFILVEHFCGMV